MKTRKIDFTKMAGAGNDFIVLNNLRGQLKFIKNRKGFVRNICHRRFGVGSDGVIFLEKTANNKADFKWDFFNADGGKAEMCGNAARCVTQYAYAKKISGKKVSFLTQAGLIRGENLSPRVVKVEMSPAKFISQLKISVGSRIYALHLVHAGVPHAVALVKKLDLHELRKVGPIIRNHSKLRLPRGANVTFVEKKRNQIIAASYERGVEDITMACGTGAVAAALVACASGYKSPVTVLMPGGRLGVTCQNLKKISLIGEALKIYEGTLDARDWL